MASFMFAVQVFGVMCGLIVSMMHDCKGVSRLVLSATKPCMHARRVLKRNFSLGSSGDNFQQVVMRFERDIERAGKQAIGKLLIAAVKNSTSTVTTEDNAIKMVTQIGMDRVISHYAEMSNRLDTKYIRCSRSDNKVRLECDSMFLSAYDAALAWFCAEVGDEAQARQIAQKSLENVYRTFAQDLWQADASWIAILLEPIVQSIHRDLASAQRARHTLDAKNMSVLLELHMQGIIKALIKRILPGIYNDLIRRIAQ